jgi:hypothetical protein
VILLHVSFLPFQVWQFHWRCPLFYGATDFNWRKAISICLYACGLRFEPPSLTAARQAEDKNSQYDEGHTNVDPVSLEPKTYNGEGDPHDRSRNQKKQAKLNQSPAMK